MATKGDGDRIPNCRGRRSRSPARKGVGKLIKKPRMPTSLAQKGKTSATSSIIRGNGTVNQPRVNRAGFCECLRVSQVYGSPW